MQLAEPETLDIIAPEALAAAIAEPAPIGAVAASLAEALADADLVCIALDDIRAGAIAAALADLCPDQLVVHLPAPDALPGEALPPSGANIGARHRALAELQAQKGRRALIIGLEAALALAPPKSTIDPALRLSPGDRIDLSTFGRQLEALGYRDDDRVDEPGEIALRGAIEVYPSTAQAPVRLDIDNGRLAAIRAFDPISQRTTEPLEMIDVGPAVWPSPDKTWVSPLAHMPRARLALDPGLDQRRRQFRALADDLTPAASGTPEPSLVSEAQWEETLHRRKLIDISALRARTVPRFAEQPHPDRAARHAIAEHLKADDRVVIAGNPRDLRFIARRLAREDTLKIVAAGSWAEAMATPPGEVVSLAMTIDAGWQEPGLYVVAAADILGSRAQISGAVAAALDPLASMVDYRVGDVVIHEDHGLAIIRGLETVVAGDARCEAIRLEHAKGAQRLVPIEEADRLWRYGSDAEAVSLDGLDGTSWTRRRGDIDTAVAATARTLIAFASERATRRADPIPVGDARYEKFVGRFPFTATRDQLRAIEAIRADLASGVPMDRLIVGDVGYGKTEVALRAAAMAAFAGRQVALIAPTTVLARQHLETFTRRFQGLGLEIAGLSRLSSPAEAKAVKAGLAEGSIDIVIATQALASKTIAFADLALTIIDEEQRFGAADKAKLRARAETGHVLTLTATPIPRTLQSALVGLQQLSVIATPPARRQPIRTATGPLDEEQLRAALLRERARGGQSFVVVPRIEDMASLAATLARLVPDLRVHQAHGKLDAAEVDAAMIAFARGQGDILLATNIIEAGLDVPRANTMIVMHADRFGLAQLHQLRGRVGRGARRGTILLLTEADQTLAPATAKRLKTLEALDHLGAGFAISAQDLDQRGAGDLVGEDQAGHVRLIGVDLYQHLLGAALAAARGEAIERWTPELHLGGDAAIPADWIAQEDIRLNLYLRLARLRDEAAIDGFVDELEDRFGPLPEAVERLIAIARIRRLACAARIQRIDAGPKAVALTPRPDFAGPVAGLEAKGERLLKRGPPGDDPLADLTALLEGLAA